MEKEDPQIRRVGVESTNEQVLQQREHHVHLYRLREPYPAMLKLYYHVKLNRLDDKSFTTNPLRKKTYEHHKVGPWPSSASPKALLPGAEPCLIYTVTSHLVMTRLIAAWRLSQLSGPFRPISNL